MQAEARNHARGDNVALDQVAHRRRERLDRVGDGRLEEAVPLADDDLRLGAVDRLLQLREERGRSDGGRQHREHDPLPAADDADVPAQAAAPVLELDRLRHATHCSASGSIS